MLDRRIRKQIEWHFYNYRADLAVIQERERDILDSRLTANYERIGSRTNSRGSRTESKALEIAMLEPTQTWADVVRNTFSAYRFEPEYDIMVALYIKKRKYSELFKEGLWETTFWRWRDKWLELAYKWAKEYKLL